MYNSLLLSTGGGIISNKQRSDQDPAPVVVIGCGGTGAMGLHVLKDKVYKQLEPDNPGEPVPRYDHIRFLEIDSDVEWVEKTSLNNDGEFCNLQDTQIRGKFDNKVTLGTMLKEGRYQWLSAGQKNGANIKIPTDLNGAGGIRQLGRYLVVNEAQKLYNNIKTAVDNAVLNRDSNKLVVHILAGISGGMGSGSFLDVCYITRKVLMDKGITGANIFGYFFLPDVITTKEEIKGDGNKIQSNYRNGYAALMELDYLMQLKENHDSFTQDYGNFQVDVNVPPVDMCHLVSAIDANGNERKDGFKYCINVTADYIMSYLSKIGAGVGDLSPKGSLANINAGVDMLAVNHGAYHRYHVLGASNAEMPMTQVATYLATGLYDKMSKILLNAPVDQDVENFVKNTLKLTVPELKKTMSQNVKLACQVPCPQMETVKMITQAYVHANSILGPMDDWLFAQQGQIDKNCQGLNEELKAYIYDSNATSLIGKMFNELTNLCLDAKYGPSYAAMMLERNGKTISAVLQGLHTEADKQAKDAKKQEDFQAEQVELAKNAFTSSKNTFLNKKIESDSYETYRGALGIWYRRKLETITYQQMDKLIVNLKDKVEQMNKCYFKKLKIMLDELKQTFEENAKYFADPKNTNNPVADDGYTMRIMVFSDLQRNLDNVLEAEKAEFAAVAFTQYLIDHADQWLSDDEYRIRQMVNDFIGNRFQTEMNKTLGDYLNEKFPGMAPAQIQQQLQTLLFKPLYDRSEPLFWCSPAANIANTYTSVSLSVPVQANDVVQAATAYGTNVAHYTLRPCQIGDRIFMVRLYSGMPLYGYHGMSLIKKAYDDNIATAGVHLYERGKINWKERLVSPTPFSIDETETKNYKNIKKAIEEAEKIGILKFKAPDDDPEDVTAAAVYQSGLLDNEDLMKLLKALNVTGDNTSEWTDAMKKEAKKKYFEEDGIYSSGLLYDTLDQIEVYMTSMKQAEDSTPLAVECDGTSNKKEVCIDHLVQAYVLRNILMEEVALYHSLELAAERLKDIDDSAEGENTIFESFFNALVLGELKQGIGKIFFTYEEKHREVEKILASKTMPMSKYLLYQAFVTFRDMEPELQDMIKENADEKMNDLQEGDDAIARKLYEKYTPKMLADLEKQYKREKEREEIEKFYTDLVDNLVSFLDQFDF